jgi:hypothetical protein
LNKYLVGIGDLEFKEANLAIINAENKQSAIDKYVANIEIKDELFLEDVYSTSVNMSYAEHLYRDNNGEYLFDNYGNEKYAIEEIEKFFEGNVRKLFKDNEEWYDLYMSMTNQEEGEEEIMFPDEMLIHMYREGKDINEILCLEIGKEIKEIV